MSERMLTPAEVQAEIIKSSREALVLVLLEEIRAAGIGRFVVMSLNQAAGILDVHTDHARRLFVETGCLDLGKTDDSRPAYKVTLAQLETALEARTKRGIRKRKPRP